MKFFKSVLIVPTVLIFVTLLSLLYSCSDDNIVSTPVTPLFIDSNFFNWKIQIAQGSLASPYQFYIADTNKVFIAGNIFGIFFDNGIVKQINYQYLYPTFSARCVNGTNENNVYFGGSEGGSNRRSQMLHWNGSSISNIELPDDSSNAISNIEIVSENDMWMSTDHNIIYRYYNSEVYSYKLDSGFFAGMVSLDTNGKVYASYYKILSGGPTSYVYLFRFYSFENDNWYIIEQDTSYYETSELSPRVSKINSDLIRIGKTGIYYRSGNNWQKFINTGGLVKQLGSVAGENRNNVMFPGAEELIGRCCYYFDGKQIYRQLANNYPASDIYYIQYKFGRYYMTTHDYFYFVTYLYIATFKNKISKF